jgi:prevent-host-death family protein
MKVVVVEIDEAKTNFSKLLKPVKAGDEVIVKNFGKPVARIVPFRAPASVRKPGALAGRITIKPGFDDLPPGLDE